MVLLLWVKPSWSCSTQLADQLKAGWARVAWLAAGTPELTELTRTISLLLSNRLPQACSQVAEQGFRNANRHTWGSELACHHFLTILWAKASGKALTSQRVGKKPPPLGGRSCITLQGAWGTGRGRMRRLNYANLYLCYHMTSSPMYLSMPSLLVRTPVIGFGTLSKFRMISSEDS